MKKTLIVMLVFVLVGFGVYWFAIKDSSNSDNAKKVDTDKVAPSTTSDETTTTTITYTNNGFEPKNYQSRVGATLIVQNNSASDLDFSSDDHPAHTKNRELNLGIISAGESKTIKLKTAGVWGFHNHLNSSHTGSITVR